MKHNALSAVADLDFDLLKAYINTGRKDLLTPVLQRQVDLCHETYGILSRQPSRAHAVRRLMALHPEMSYSTAGRFVDFTRQTWGDYLGYTRQFLESFFINALLEDISAEDADPQVRSRNLATLQKHLERMPDQVLDPRVMEKNTVNIQVNVAGGGTLTLSEEALQRLPQSAREALLSALEDGGSGLSDAEAVEILG